MRKTILSVTNFLYFGDDYLMLHRQKDAQVDANKVNGIGGKVESGENYLDAAIRETKEETGYIVTPEDITFIGLVRLEEGYPTDWVMAFFKIKVQTKEIPHGNHVKDGELLWMHKDEVLGSKFQLVDDLNYCWKEIVNNQTFFMSTIVGTDEKIKNYTITKLPQSF